MHGLRVVSALAAAPSDAQTEVAGNTVTLTSCAPAGGAAPVSEAR